MKKNQNDKYIEILEEIIWKGKPICPRCKAVNPYVLNNSRYQHKCRECYHHFNVRSGTIFDGSKLPLKDWFAIIANFSSIKSQSAMARGIGITQRSGNLIYNKIKSSPSVLEWVEKYPQYFDDLKIDFAVPVPEKTKKIHYEGAKRYRKENPQVIRNLKKREHERMPDWYIKQLIGSDDPELVELKRLQLQLYRESKKQLHND